MFAGSQMKYLLCKGSREIDAAARRELRELSVRIES